MGEKITKLSTPLTDLHHLSAEELDKIIMGFFDEPGVVREVPGLLRESTFTQPQKESGTGSATS